MTEIAFHFNMPHKLPYTLRLLRKAVAAGACVTVTGEPQALRLVDMQLWELAPHEFVPHCQDVADAAVLAYSPVLLTAQIGGQPKPEVLVNLGPEVPLGFERFERVIEMVSLDEADRHAGRLRWRHYAERGYAIVRHDINVKGSGS
jgi:DNA polymerase-3 subunit chi